MGPLAHARRVTAMTEFVEDASARGARIELGGQRIGTQGNFFAPTILAAPPEGARIMQAEPFGPIAACVLFQDLDEAIRRANSLPYGLSSYAFTTSSRNALRIQNGLEAGMVNINHFGQSLAGSAIWRRQGQWHRKRGRHRDVRWLPGDQVRDADGLKPAASFKAIARYSRNPLTP